MPYDALVSSAPVIPGVADAIPPALSYQLGEVFTGSCSPERIAKLISEGEPWFGAAPSLANLGYWLIAPEHDTALRVQGCAWLAMFPSPEAARQLAALVTSSTTPRPVREQAIWTLGCRQLGSRHPSTSWSAETIRIADAALEQLADQATNAGSVASDQLAPALRHLQSDLLAAMFAKAPTLWSDALEWFATPPLARVLLVSLDDIPATHRIRVLRLIAATLGEEAVPLMLASSPSAPIEERLERRFLAVAVGGEQHLGGLEDLLRGHSSIERQRRRARWHLAHRGLIPTVRGLRVARTSALLPPAERALQCAQAADDLAALTRYTRYEESYIYSIWAAMVRASEDPVRATELVAAHPGSQQAVHELYLEDLARRGQVTRLIATAHDGGALDRAALLLAMFGRPLAALELAGAAQHHTPELVCARALACYRVGRPDLTEQILDQDLPCAELTGPTLERFPGAHERWMIERASKQRPAFAALTGGVDGVVALARLVPDDAEPDRGTLASVGTIVHRLRRRVAGATVYLAGDIEHSARMIERIERVGGRVVSGPIPGTDFYMLGEGAPITTIVGLERNGARQLRPDDLSSAEDGR